MTDVFIIGGFLGSGKTTMLANIISQEKKAGRKIAVLMNELGKVSLDSYFIDEGIPLKELYDGCICCTLQDRVESQVQELLSQNELDAIYIETTGAAHPVEVLDSIMSPFLADKLKYRGIITVVDLLGWKRREEFSPQVRQLLYEQVYHGDFLLLNKMDLVAEIEAAAFVFEIQSINSSAEIVLTQNAAVSIKQLQTVNMTEKTEHSKADIGRQLKLSALTYDFKGSISQTDFENWLRSLPESIYRMKGFLPFKSHTRPVLFQYSYGMPLYMNQEMKMPLKLVVIGEQLDKQRLAQQLSDMEQ
ncbi:CobW family GTP-binding protein [Peribacillus kribbensis]|uniref:CobW family GTP-binding protein n=1 Tax=Peribacillus kribbensis TaxID=356658 RepID=UPI0004111020|nr:GTP-binding protein [Peribacillus kribbensis]